MLEHWSLCAVTQGRGGTAHFRKMAKMAIKRQRGRPRTISGGKRINIYLSLEQIEWLKSTGNMSQTLQKLIEKAKEANNLRESPDPPKHY